VSEKPNPVVKTIERDGETINVYQDGTEYNVTRGHIARGPDEARITTSEKGREMVARRRELNQQAAEEEADAAAEDAIATGKISIRGDNKDRLGLRVFTRKNFDLVIDAKTGRGVEGPNTTVLKLTGWAAPEEPATVNNINVIQFPPEVLRAITDLHARLKPSQPSQVTLDIIEGRLEPLDEE
jgi:hypothetical protein